MAVEVRTRRLVNPSSATRQAKRYIARSKKHGPQSPAQFLYKAKQSRKRLVSRLEKSLKNPKKKRKLSPKQIAIFGTPRQKAALRAKRTRNAGKNSIRKTKKRGVKYTKVYGSPYSNVRVSRKKRRKNVGEIVSISLAGLNPGVKRKKRKVNVMAKRRRKNAGTKFGRSWSSYSAKKRKKNPGVRRRRRSTHAVDSVAVKRRRRRTSNPMYKVRRVRRVGRRRSNPGFLSGVGTGLLPKAIGFLGGMIGARYLTQMVLGSNNTGYVGYAGNVAASVVLGMVAGKVTKSKELGNTVLVGGIAGTLLRVIFDKTPYGSFIQSQLNGLGKGGDAGMGIISDSSFFSPQVAQPGSMTNFITPRATRNYVSGQMAQTAAMTAAGSPGSKGVGSMVGRRARGQVV